MMARGRGWLQGGGTGLHAACRLGVPGLEGTVKFLN